VGCLQFTVGCLQIAHCQLLTAHCHLLYGICKLSHHICEHGAGFDFIHSFQNQPDMNKDLILKTDILDIIFEKRNKSYGAYDLRKFYPGRLKQAMGFMFAVAVAFSAFTLLPEKQHGNTNTIFVKEDPTFTNVDETPKEKPKKLEIKRPDVAKPQTKQAVAPQTKFISNIAIVDKGIKTDTVKTLTIIDPIGSKNIVNAHPVTILVTPVKTGPNGGGETPVATLDKTAPMDADVVEVLPAYPGGMDALRKFLEKNLQIPGEMETGETVNVRVKFVVDYTGKLRSFVTVLDGGQVYNNEVIRVLKKMPDWIPGRAKGENVSVYYIIPVKFTAAD
jgi:protein TonB